MILAGGLSTRLYPLTKQVPKPLVPVAGEPNAAHVIRYLAAYGYDEVAINVHYLADAIVAALGDGSKFGVRIEYLHERELLGSAGAVRQLERFLSREPFVVVGCDDLTNLPLDALTSFRAKNDALAAIGLVEMPEVEQYGVVVTNAAGRVTGFQEKPSKGSEKSHLVNTGIYAFTPEIFAHIPAGEFYDFGKQVFPSLQASDSAFYGYDARGAYWCDIGTPSEYRRASYDVVNGAFRIPGSRGNGIAPSANVDRDARIEGNVWIGAGVRVERGAHVMGPCVLGDGAQVEADAMIARSILWDRVSVGRAARVLDSIVGIDYTVQAEASLEDCILANETDALAT